MKPIKLTMSAYGSYAENTVIDFSDVNHGIFLITGDTGAGKTTIFDAIVYALYDRASGGARESADMRSQYASADTPTYVEYVFSYRNDVYTIRRNPRYSRLSKRRDKDGNLKETEEAPSVTLLMPDGREFPGKIRDINEKIVEIIGLDADQFTQIAMIAQGEFMKLLQASSNQRREIFAKIFDTKIYGRIQEELRAQTKGLYGKLEDNRRYCEVELQGIRLLPDTEYFVFSEASYEETLNRLRKLIHQGRELEETSKEDLVNLEKSIVSLNQSITEGKQINEIFKGLQQAEEEKKRLEQEGRQQLQKQQELEFAKRAIPVMMEAVKLEKSRKALDETQKRLQLLVQYLQEYTSLTKEKEERKDEAQKRLQDSQPSLQEQITRLKDIMPNYAQVESLRLEVQSLEKQVTEWQTKCEQIVESLEKQRKDLYEKNQQASKLLTVYQQANDTFIAEQAGVMASKLVDGEPCPVCGATKHPDKAHFSGEAITQAQVEQAKQSWQKTNAEMEAANSRLEQQKQEYDKQLAAAQELKLQAQTVKAQYDLKLSSLPYRTRKEAEAVAKNLEKELVELQTKARRAEVDWQESNRILAETDAQKKLEEEQEKRLEKEILEDTRKYETILAAQGFQDEVTYHDAYRTEAEREQLEKELLDYQNRVVKNRTSIEHFSVQALGKTPVEMQEFEVKLQQQQRLKEEQDAVVMKLHGDNVRNQEAYEKLTKLFAKRQELKGQYDIYANLDKTANGNLSGTAKLDFQTFIQRKYFDRIIHEANKRLVKMTSNQFILKCRELQKLGSQGAVGLDLDVYSLVNDKTRDVKTLSGGESFMAALSMALGMADVIQNAAGRVRLDTMFVDEGFGSLDDESREEAIRILHELAGNQRLVGIISHVTELKEQIDRKLIVKKDEKGSRALWN